MIQIEPEDIERIRERLRKMSDLELRKYGRAARDLSDPKKNYGPPNPSFKIQLDEARAEWRKASLRFCRCLARRPRVQFRPPPPLNRFRSC